MECSKECSTCISTCGMECPICHKKGINVPFDTVLALSKELKLKMNSNYYICTNPICDVAYFSDDGQIIKKDEVKVDIWFKKNNKNYIVCYCRNIHLKDIIKAVTALDDVTKENIIKYLEKDKIKTNCLVNNPLGKNCDILFQNAIEYALKIKNQQKED